MADRLTPREQALRDREGLPKLTDPVACRQVARVLRAAALRSAVAMPTTEPSTAPGGQSPVAGIGATEPSATRASLSPSAAAAQSPSRRLGRSTHANETPDPTAA